MHRGAAWSALCRQHRGVMPHSEALIMTVKGCSLQGASGLESVCTGPRLPAALQSAAELRALQSWRSMNVRLRPLTELWLTWMQLWVSFVATTVPVALAGLKHGAE